MSREEQYTMFFAAAMMGFLTRMDGPRPMYYINPKDPQGDDSVRLMEVASSLAESALQACDDYREYAEATGG